MQKKAQCAPFVRLFWGDVVSSWGSAYVIGRLSSLFFIFISYFQHECFIEAVILHVK